MTDNGSAMRWVLAYTSAVAGDATYFVVLTWAATRAGGPLWSGVVLAAGAIPRALLMLPGGVLADRLNPRRLVIGTDSARCAVMLIAAGITTAVGLVPGWLLTVAVVFGIVDAVFMPAVGAMPARLVAVKDRTQLQAWRVSGLRVSNTVGPALGGLLVTVAAPSAFAVIAALFAVSVALLISVRVSPQIPASKATEKVDLRSSITQLRECGLGRLVLATALSEIPFSGPVAVGFVLLTQQRAWPATTSGLVLAAFSIGGLVASLVCTRLSATLHGGRTLLSSTSGTALLLCLVALTPTAPAVIAVGSLLGVSTGISMVVSHGRIQQTAPTEILGRVTALLTLLTLGLSPVLFAGAGTVTAVVGIAPFFYGAALIMLIAVGVLARVPRVST